MLVDGMLPSLQQAMFLVQSGMNVASLRLDMLYHRNDLRWAEMDYYLQLRQVRIDMFNNAREELQDLFEKGQRDLDTNLVVVTLMIGFGFGFTCEGTFPKDTGGFWVQWVRDLYAGVCAMSLVCPFIALLIYIECRRRMIFFMKQFNKMNVKIMREEAEQFRTARNTAETPAEKARAYTQGLPTVPTEQVSGSVQSCCRRRSRMDGHTDGVHKHGCTMSAPTKPPEPLHSERCVPSLPSHVIEDRQRQHSGDVAPKLVELRRGRRDLIMGVHADYLEYWDKWVWPLYEVARMFRSMSIFMNVWCCSLLVGLYFSAEYSDTPWVAYTYVIVVTIGIISALVFTWWFDCNGPDRFMSDTGDTAGSQDTNGMNGALQFCGCQRRFKYFCKLWKYHNTRPGGKFLPIWMKQPLEPLLNSED